MHRGVQIAIEGTPSHSGIFSSLSLCLRRLTDTIPLGGGGGGSARDLYSSDPDYLNIFFSLIIPTIFSYDSGGTEAWQSLKRSSLMARVSG